MEIFLFKTTGARINITDIVESLSWSGSIEQASRILDITVINAPFDPVMAQVSRFLELGDFISVEKENVEIFFGQVYTLEKSSDIGTVTYNCYDIVNHLLKSKGKYNFKNMTAEGIAARVCAELSIPAGNFARTGVNIKTMIVDGTSIYDTIMQAYTKAYKVNHKMYQLVQEKRAISVIEVGTKVANFRLSEESNITKTSQSESINDMINRVKIYNEKGTQIGEVSDSVALKKFGAFQEVYTAEKGIQPKVGATSMLKGMTQNLSIEAVGDTRCVAGMGVEVYDITQGISGLYWISSDKHEFKESVHTMTLELSFKRLMDIKEDQEA